MRRRRRLLGALTKVAGHSRRAVSSTCASRQRCQIRLPGAAHGLDPAPPTPPLARTPRGPPATHQAAAEDGPRPDLQVCRPTAVAGRCPEPNTKKKNSAGRQPERNRRGERGEAPPPPSLLAWVVWLLPPPPGTLNPGRQTHSHLRRRLFLLASAAPSPELAPSSK
jgi:hypothetical protein